MNKLEPSEIELFLARFNSFYDGLLYDIQVRYGFCAPEDAHMNGLQVTLLLATRDLKETKNDGWVCVRLAIQGVQSYCFVQPRNTNVTVLFYGLRLIQFGGALGIELGDLNDPPASEEELTRSTFFVIGTAIDWSLEPYVGRYTFPSKPA